jgi:hypothetical protein
MSEVFAYEVTRSSDVAVRVGSCLIDVEHDGEPVRTWRLWNSKTGDFSGGWTALRRDRLCATCYGWRGVRFIRLDAHEGDHGPGEQFVPEWIAKREAEIAEVEPPASTVTKWFCRNAAGSEFEWPTEKFARDHVAKQGCALVKKTIRRAVVVAEAQTETTS